MSHRAFAISAALLASIPPLSAIGQTISPDVLWRLESVAGQPFEGRVTIQIGAQGEVSGQASCNQYIGQNTATLPEFTVGPMAVTRMACPEMDTEQEYLTALGQVTRVEMEEEKLVLYDSTGSQMVFVEFVPEE